MNTIRLAAFGSLPNAVVHSEFATNTPRIAITIGKQCVLRVDRRESKEYSPECRIIGFARTIDGGIELEGMAYYGPRLRNRHDLTWIMVVGSMLPVNYPSSCESV